MNNKTTLFVDVLLPLALPNFFTYRIPEELNEEIAIGKRVVVQFGKHKIYTALIYNIHQNNPKDVEAKYILSVLDNIPIVNTKQFKLWEWISNYYMCTLGEVMNAALPSALKLASETKIILHPEYNNYQISQLSENELIVINRLEYSQVLNISEVSKLINVKNVINFIKNLFEKKLVILEEEIVDKYKPKTDFFIGLNESFKTEDALKEIFNKLEKKSPKQLEVLMSLVYLLKSNSVNEIGRKVLLQHSKAAIAQINALIDKKIIFSCEKEISRFNSSKETDNLQLSLSEIQQNALNQIVNSFIEKDVVLLHGVTSSGKTEIYIQLIKQQIENNKQVLYLLPEIALTSQIINRLRKYFGDKVVVYHSKFNEQERAEIWTNIVKSEYYTNKINIVLGARSSIFLPFNNLGLIIIDEEHDSSYKQNEPSPRYNGRDVAIILSKYHEAKVILGSATPSVESYFNAQSGKYGFVTIKERFGGVNLPEIEVVNIKEEFKLKRMKSHFSEKLLQNIETALKNKEQVIIFQNRRGFSTRIECEKCNWIPTCKNCDVTLTYHKQQNQMRCHYCGYTTKVHTECPACKSNQLTLKGYGTERIEDELPVFFPKSKIARMDLDSTRGKHAHTKIINDFEEGNIDILVGTQMVTKGLDFNNVSLVCIINADNMLFFPNFRAYERSFQLMAQVSGRAGRKNKRGYVIIQTYNTQNQVIRYVVNNDYESFYQSQIIERKNFKYPPFYRLIELTIKHKSDEIVNSSSKELALLLRKNMGNRILGPDYPEVARINNEFIRKIIIKIERETSINNIKLLLIESINKIKHNIKSIKIIIDVDPY